MHEFEAILSGRVQMVMFRDFTRRRAKWRGIAGTVENQEDGTVRVVAQGEKEKLDAFLSDLQRGSPLSRVDAIQVTWREPATPFSSFTIVYHSLIDRL